MPSSLLSSLADCARALETLSFRSPVTHCYNPLIYAWKPHATYLERYGSSPKRVLFLGMNPGPFGMAQTGIPFGEVTAVRNWLHICEPVAQPPNEHPARPIQGFACRRSEVSGKRLWGLFAQRFQTADCFFQQHFVANYCPLVFMEASGKNRTPQQLPADERAGLTAHCDQALTLLVDHLAVEYIVGVGLWAYQRAAALFGETSSASSPKHRQIKPVNLLHPSPASPLANQGWSSLAIQQLEAAGVW